MKKTKIKTKRKWSKQKNPTNSVMKIELTIGFSTLICETQWGRQFKSNETDILPFDLSCLHVLRYNKPFFIKHFNAKLH